MEVTFYGKNSSFQQSPTHQEHSQMASKAEPHFIEYKGLTLKEYFMRSERTTYMHSDSSRENAAIFEGELVRKQKKLMKRIWMKNASKRTLRNNTEVAEIYREKPEDNSYKQIKRPPQHQFSTETNQNLPMPKVNMPMNQSPSFSIRQSLALFTKRNHPVKHSFPTPSAKRNQSLLDSTQSTRKSRLIPSPYEIRMTRPLFLSEKRKGKGGDGAQGEIHSKEKYCKWKEILKNISDAAELKNTYAHHRRLVTDK